MGDKSRQKMTTDPDVSVFRVDNERPDLGHCLAQTCEFRATNNNFIVLGRDEEARHMQRDLLNSASQQVSSFDIIPYQFVHTIRIVG